MGGAWQKWGSDDWGSHLFEGTNAELSHRPDLLIAVMCCQVVSQ